MGSFRGGRESLRGVALGGSFGGERKFRRGGGGEESFEGGKRARGGGRESLEGRRELRGGALRAIFKGIIKIEKKKKKKKAFTRC